MLRKIEKWIAISSTLLFTCMGLYGIFFSQSENAPMAIMFSGVLGLISWFAWVEEIQKEEALSEEKKSLS